MKRKITSLFCLFAMLLTFVSCGKGGNDTTVPATDDGTESESGVDSTTGAEEEKLTEDLKVMYYNVYGYGKIDVPDRLKIQVEMIADSGADIVCMQEFDSTHRKGALRQLQSKGYKELAIDSNGKVLYKNTINCEPIFYRTDKLTLVESGGELFPEWVTINGEKLYGNNGNTKSYAWGVFKENSTGKLFLVVNAHFMWTDTSKLTYEQADMVRTDNANRILSLIEQVKASKDEYASIPVIFGGDLNCRPDSEPYNTLKAKMSVASEAAEEYEKLGYYGGYASYNAETGEYNYYEPSESDNIIDHAFVTGVTLKSYLPIKSRDALITSDHLPWVLTFVF